MGVQLGADSLQATPRRTTAMNLPNPPLLPEVLLGPRCSDQPNLDLASEGVQRYLWQSAYGPMLIEVRDGEAFVNGKRVLSIAELRASEPRA
jgi:hypothetical protein